MKGLRLSQMTRHSDPLTFDGAGVAFYTDAAFRR